MGRLRIVHTVILGWLAMAATGCPLFIAGAAGGAAGTVASVEESQDEHHSPATYAGTVLVDVFYFPAKVVVAGAGVVISSLAYLVTVGDSSAFSSVWNSAVKGDYVVTPRMIEGKERVHFFGSNPGETE